MYWGVQAGLLLVIAATYWIRRVGKMREPLSAVVEY